MVSNIRQLPMQNRQSLSTWQTCKDTLRLMRSEGKLGRKTVELVCLVAAVILYGVFVYYSIDNMKQELAKANTGKWFWHDYRGFPVRPYTKGDAWLRFIPQVIMGGLIAFPIIKWGYLSLTDEHSFYSAYKRVKLHHKIMQEKL